MELWLALLVLAIGVLPLIALAVAASAASKAADAQRRIVAIDELLGSAAALERRLALVEHRLGDAMARTGPLQPPMPVQPAEPVEPAMPAQPARPPEPPEPAARPAAASPAGATPEAAVSLEQWLGVRGAAGLGAGALVLAGLYFFKYSIDHGLITPVLRVVLGAAVGIGSALAAEIWVRARHALLANCLAGAGIAILYLCFWSAAGLYQLIPMVASAALMVLVTACCCVLSVRRDSTAIAVLGLLGGFATPLLLSTGSDRPVALFSYLVLLDAALLYVAHRRRSPLLAVASLIGTAGYQALWIVGRMGPARVGWGMLLALVFGALFAVARTRRSDGSDRRDERPMWLVTRAAAVLLPFVFAIYFGLHAELGTSFARNAIYLGVLITGAGVMSHRDRLPWLLLAAALAALGIVVTWLVVHADQKTSAWQLTGFFVGIALVLQGFLELARRREGEIPVETRAAASLWRLVTIVAGGLVAAIPSGSPWPWLCGWLALALLGWRHGAIVASARQPLASALASAIALALLAATHAGEAPALVMLALLAFAAIFQAAGTFSERWWEDRGQGRERANQASALLSLGLIAALGWLPLDAWLSLIATLALAVSIGLAVVRSRAAAWLVAGAALTALVPLVRHHDLLAASGVLAPAAAADLAIAYLGQALAAVLFATLPLLLDERARGRVWTWRAAALAPLIFSLPMVALHERSFGDGAIGIVPVALAALALSVMLAARRRLPAEMRTSALAWLGGGALALAAVAVPLQLDREWVTIGWALMATAWIALWRRIDHPGLKWLGLGLLAAVFARLVLGVDVLGDHPRSGTRLFNWISYTYLLPAACMLASARLLGGLESERLRGWEPRFQGAPLGAPALGLGTVVVVFAWLNLTVLDWFSTGRRLTSVFERMPARDLTLSLSWAVYALVLLGVGMHRGSSGLRRASLVLVLATCVKVFLHDLSHLGELYRVMSLVGLALSLIAVSLAYQRFVFRSAR